jgi:hypothetical protein
MSGLVDPVCRPSGPLAFYFAPATEAFDLGRGCTSPPGLEPTAKQTNKPASEHPDRNTRGQSPSFGLWESGT